MFLRFPRLFQYVKDLSICDGIFGWGFWEWWYGCWFGYRLSSSWFLIVKFENKSKLERFPGSLRPIPSNPKEGLTLFNGMLTQLDNVIQFVSRGVSFLGWYIGSCSCLCPFGRARNQNNNTCLLSILIYLIGCGSEKVYRSASNEVIC